MTKEFLRLIELLQFGVFGTMPQRKTEADLEDVLRIALKQGVLPIVYASLDETEKKHLAPKWEQMFFRSMIKNEQKNAVLSGIVKKLDAEGITYCILKGATVARYYYLSQCRLSGDIDLYVKPEDEDRAEKFFRSLGMEVEARPASKHDFKVSSPASGLIEVHIALYAENFRHVVLKDRFGISEPFIPLKINDILTVNSLGKNDMLEFLTTHFIKHFVREGSGIKQIMDLLAFVKANYAEIDFDKYFKKLEELKFKDLILNVLGIGVKYFGLEFKEYSLLYTDRILDDVENGENFGFGDAKRQGFYEQFMKNRARNDEEATREMEKRKKKNIFRALLVPEREYLIRKGYVYLGKTPLLYPVAYVHRLWNVFVSVLLRKRNVRKAMGFAKVENQVINSRLELMEDLKII